MIKFLHAADLHLDAPFSALSPEQAAARRQEQRALLTDLAEAANAQDCDVVLLAGDLFDSSSVGADAAGAPAGAGVDPRAGLHQPRQP